MAMNLGPSLGQQDDDEVIGTINTTPLVDVMLVLLIIFLITIPVVTTSIKVDLPKEQNVVRVAKPDTVIISVNQAGQIFLYDSPVKNPTELVERLQKFARMQPQPDVQIRGDATSAFESVGRVMYAAQRAGIVQVGFVTDPQP
jgi:biopolymer transport protein ExbD